MLVFFFAFRGLSYSVAGRSQEVRKSAVTILPCSCCPLILSKPQKRAETCPQGAAGGGRQKEFDHFFCFRDSFSHFCRKNPHVRNLFCPQFWGQKWLRQFYGRLAFWFFPNFILMGAGIFLILVTFSDASVKPLCRTPFAAG